ncbi:hypothetical protein [Pseudoalteromonas phage J2-1_QLiu-2017]|nr:hypothetical protein [Pseudoalteromonas phage J2-1_QLiu-2017]
MPQIPPAFIPDFVTKLTRHFGVSCSFGIMDSGSIRPTQMQVNNARVEKKIEDIKECPHFKAIIVDKEGRQLDGHNTVVAANRLGGLYLPVFAFPDLSIVEIINFAKNNYPLTTFKSLEDLG